MTKHEQIKNITITAVLAALIIILAFLPIKTMALEITLTIIPITIGLILCGPKGGAILGLVFGVVSFLQCLGYSQFGLTLLSINPFLTFLVCVPTRILAGLLAGLVYKGLNKVVPNNLISIAVASVLMPLLNTIFFMGTLTVCFYNTDYIQMFVGMIGATNPLNFIILFTGINGLVEIICGIVISIPVAKALTLYLHQGNVVVKQEVAEQATIKESN